MKPIFPNKDTITLPTITGYNKMDHGIISDKVYINDDEILCIDDKGDIQTLANSGNNTIANSNTTNKMSIVNTAKEGMVLDDDILSFSFNELDLISISDIISDRLNTTLTNSTYGIISRNSSPSNDSGSVSLIINNKNHILNLQYSNNRPVKIVCGIDCSLILLETGRVMLYNHTDNKKYDVSNIENILDIKGGVYTVNGSNKSILIAIDKDRKLIDINLNISSFTINDTAEYVGSSNNFNIISTVKARHHYISNDGDLYYIDLDGKMKFLRNTSHISIPADHMSRFLITDDGYAQVYSYYTSTYRCMVMVRENGSVVINQNSTIGCDSYANGSISVGRYSNTIINKAIIYSNGKRYGVRHRPHLPNRIIIGNGFYSVIDINGTLRAWGDDSDDMNTFVSSLPSVRLKLVEYSNGIGVGIDIDGNALIFGNRLLNTTLYDAFEPAFISSDKKFTKIVINKNIIAGLTDNGKIVAVSGNTTLNNNIANDINSSINYIDIALYNDYLIAINQFNKTEYMGSGNMLKSNVYQRDMITSIVSNDKNIIGIKSHIDFKDHSRILVEDRYVYPIMDSDKINIIIDDNDFYHIDKDYNLRDNFKTILYENILQAKFVNGKMIAIKTDGSVIVKAKDCNYIENIPTFNTSNILSNDMVNLPDGTYSTFMSTSGNELYEVTGSILDKGMDINLANDIINKKVCIV